MFFYSGRVKLLKQIFKNIRYYKVLARSQFIIPGDKVLYIDPSNIRINRYLYNFLKFFKIMGYVVYFPKNKEIINSLFGKQGESVFVSWLLKEKFIKLGKPSNNLAPIYISKENISNNYFQTFSLEKHNPKMYHVPMSEFPVIYHRYKWQEDFEKNKIRKKIYFYDR